MSKNIETAKTTEKTDANKTKKFFTLKNLVTLNSICLATICVSSFFNGGVLVGKMTHLDNVVTILAEQEVKSLDHLKDLWESHNRSVEILLDLSQKVKTDDFDKEIFDQTKLDLKKAQVDIDTLTGRGMELFKEKERLEDENKFLKERLESTRKEFENLMYSHQLLKEKLADVTRLLEKAK